MMACYLCYSSRGQLRDHGGIRIILCAECNRYVVRVAKRVQA